MVDTLTGVVRGVAIFGVVAFLGVLLWRLGQHIAPLEIAFSTALGVLAIGGGIGVLQKSSLVGTAGAGGLWILSFWQNVLWLYVSPVAALLLLASLLTDHVQNTTSAAA